MSTAQTVMVALVLILTSVLWYGLRKDYERADSELDRKLDRLDELNKDIK